MQAKNNPLESKEQERKPNMAELADAFHNLFNQLAVVKGHTELAYSKTCEPQTKAHLEEILFTLGSIEEEISSFRAN